MNFRLNILVVLLLLALGAFSINPASHLKDHLFGEHHGGASRPAFVPTPSPVFAESQQAGAPTLVESQTGFQTWSRTKLFNGDKL